MAPATRNLVAQAFGAWLAFQVMNGDVDLAAPLPARLTPPRLADYLEWLRPRYSDKTVEIQIAGLLEAVRVMEPHHDWKWLRRVVSRLKANARPARNKRPRMRPIEDLLRLGIDLMAEAEADERRCLERRATLYRDGLLIALLAARPLRISTIRALRLGSSLVRQSGAWFLQLDRLQMEAGAPFEAPVPDGLAPHLDRYLAHWRPLFVGRTELDHVWISKDGRPLASRSMYGRISHWTARRLGTRINPHLFRDCAATTIAIKDPEHVRYATTLLQHRSRVTTDRFYNHARGLDAARSYQRNLIKLRKSLTAKGRR